MAAVTAAPQTGRAPVLVDLGSLLCGLSFEALPGPVVRQAKLALFHNLVVALAARALPLPGQDRARWPEPLPGPAATRLTDGRLGPAEATVYTNALAMGARAQHDEHSPTISHLGSTVVPAALAVACQRRLAGRDFLTALVAGYEAGARVGAVSVEQTVARGFRSTGLYGPFAAAASAARAWDLPADQTTASLGIAASFAGGLTQTWLSGGQEWRHQTAAAARNGYAAAELARAGVRAAEDVLEGRAGFYRAYAGTGLDPDGCLKPMGSPWAVEELLLKRYPICALNQAPVAEALALTGGHPLRPDDLDTLTVRMHPAEADYPGVDAPGRPSTLAAALMDVRFCVAAAVVRGRVDLQDLQDPQSVEAAVPEVAARVDLVRDSGVPRRHTRVALRLRGGNERCSAQPARVYYTPDTAQQLALSLLPLMRVSAARLERLRRLVFSLEDCGDVGNDLFALCRPARPEAGR